MFPYFFKKLSIIFISSFFLSIGLLAYDTKIPSIDNGILHISENIKSPLPLDGNWKFYWKQFREDIKEDASYIYIPVPSGWTGIKLKNENKYETITAHGYGTYTLKIIFNENIDTNSLGISFKDFGSSYQAFVNGKLIARNGKVGRTEQDSLFDMKTHIAKFPNTNDNEYLIEIEVSNYDNTNGGFWNRAYIGELDKLYEQKFTNSSFIFFFNGITAIIGIYSILYFLYLKNFKSSLYFGCFSLLLGLRNLITGERIFSDLFPQIPFSIIYKLEYLSLFLALPCFSKYLVNLFPNIIPKYLANIFNSIILFCALLVIILPSNLYAHTLKIVQPMIIIFGIITSYHLIIQIKEKSKDATIVFISLIFLLTGTINDILFHETIWKSVILTPYTLILFIFLHGMLLGKRFASSFKKSKFLSEELIKVNSNLEEKIRDRTKDLESKIQSISNDLNMAKNIQERILGVDTLSNEYFEFKAIYEPIEELGGDFYDIFEISNYNYRIMIADATGHGIQAALVTMAIKSEYEYAKFHFEKPSEIIYFMNQQFCIKYKNLKMYFTCLVLDFNCITGDIKFSSAGHPNQILVRNNERIEELSSFGSIIGLTKNSVYDLFHNKIKKNDAIFLFTDGWIEQHNAIKEMYGEKRFYDSILKHNSEDLNLTLINIKHEINTFLNKLLIQDDLALLAILKR